MCLRKSVVYLDSRSPLDVAAAFPKVMGKTVCQAAACDRRREIYMSSTEMDVDNDWVADQSSRSSSLAASEAVSEYCSV